MAEIKRYAFKAGLPVEFEIMGMRDLFEGNKSILANIHRTGFYHILWFQQGAPTHLVDFKPVPITPETILFLNKDLVQRFDGRGGFDGKIMVFTDSFFIRTEADATYLRSSPLFHDLFSPSLLRLPQGSPLLREYLALMEAELTHPQDSVQPLVLKNLLHTFLLLAERERESQAMTQVRPSVELDSLLLFRDLLEQKFRRQKQVGLYAEQLGMTEKKLNQATSKVLGKSAKQMIDDRVMLEAKRLLAHTPESIKEIGFALGFEEPTNFIKYFRRHQGSTPAEFRGQAGLA
ncbi:helix-turn-helix transcriptional regulator [Rufibacter glacialis]|uniref:Helix-turn-helix domain-containing protein n=1 Tax=Rufibacter glacialis TaxID=1259555 RepID=A0A5M8QT49_9BACT|nr:helix-turn-helix transcriptional regulator [Rufibacter glacialis]KAA6437806.1 helix-turn-helix domain-containing protein [Rufibacter glacialis]GGK56114.1 transcriptional regulator [Rufibacter glacialis]